MSQQENIKRFEDMLVSVERDGMDNLIRYIRQSDFYTAPASTRFHSCHEGGLLEHTLNVYDCLVQNFNTLYRPPDGDGFFGTDKNVIVSALLHDLCKADYYTTEYKNQKVYSDHGTKSDNKGRFDWESVPVYTVDDQHPLGHGEKSVMMAESFIRLEPVERYAIRWHMGFTEPKENWNYLSAAIRKYPLVLALHVSDLEATYLMEEEK